MSNLKRIHFLVHGRVQGVFFRDHAQSAAEAHSITGYVRNTDDSKVQGEAQGTEANLRKFLKEVEVGSDGSKVHKVETEEREVKEGEKEFTR